MTARAAAVSPMSAHVPGAGSSELGRRLTGATGDLRVCMAESSVAIIPRLYRRSPRVGVWRSPNRVTHLSINVFASG